MSSSPDVISKVNSQRALWSKLGEIVGREYLREASENDNLDGVHPQMVAEPANEAQLSAVLQAADAAECKVIPRGGGTKLNWGNAPNACDLIISTARLDCIREHAWGDMTATVEAGCTVQRLQDELAKHGQRLAIDPLWPERATIGGILATNDGGSLRVRFGSLRDLIIGVTIVLADGTIAKSGGKVVKNVAGYDLPKLMTGALGTLGVMTTAVFRLHPLPRKTSSITVSADTTAELQKLATAVHDSQLAYTGLQLRVEATGASRLDVRFEGTDGGISAQVNQLVNLCSGLEKRTEDANPDVWNLREQLFAAQPDSVTVKFSVLPAALSDFCEAVSRVGKNKIEWKIIAQSVGVGLLQIRGDTKSLAENLKLLRVEAEKLSRLGEMAGGSLVVLTCPTEMKASLDVWGPISDTQPLFRSLKRQFDPKATLNPGRFIGGI